MVNPLQTARMAGGALMTNPFRTALTTLGIVIGITAVILLTALGGGVQQQITAQIDSLGANTLQVSPGTGRGAGGGRFGAATVSNLTLSDVDRVAALSTVAAVSPVVQTTAPLDGRSISLTGVAPNYASIRTISLDAGRFVAATGEIVLDADVALTLTGSTVQAAIGRTVTIHGTSYTVVGVSHVDAGSFGPQQLASSFVHIDDALKITGGTTISQIAVLARDAASVDAAAAEMKAVLVAAHGAEDFSISTQAQLLATASQITNLLTYLLAGIASISLVVGGIGIMNIMLVSVAERTREIGLRKALGATDLDVLTQFLLEAIFLSLGGGLLGVAAGVGLATLAPNISSDLPTQITATSVGLAFGVAAAIGVVFGVLPAFRSARLQPVEALRRE
jgi:putative ABC transport system permease protein